MKLLTLGNPKTQKGLKFGYLTAVLHLHPNTRMCPNASKGCFASCLNTAGRGGIIKRGETTNAILEARKRKTAWLQDNHHTFGARLVQDMLLLRARAKRMGLKPALRLNGTSDVPWERHGMHTVAKGLGIQLYDYTKSFERAMQQPYTLHFSRSEKPGSDKDVERLLRSGISCVVVTETGVPSSAAYHYGLPYDRVISGDEHDLRFIDPPGSLVVVKAKGRARHDRTGFVLPC